MKKKVSRAAARKAAPVKVKKAPARRLALKAAPDAMSADEVAHLETLVKRFEESEKAWQRMTAPIEDDPWTQVEEHMVSRREDSERTWKFFSK